LLRVGKQQQQLEASAWVLNELGQQMLTGLLSTNACGAAIHQGVLNMQLTVCAKHSAA
jgi:hypothetical protein